MNYIAPAIRIRSFTCPYCDTLAEQKWDYSGVYTDGESSWINSSSTNNAIFLVSISTCQSCRKYHVWIADRMMVPDSVNVPMPNDDMPLEIKDIYMEARSIVDKSPKAAAALLRLALQQLCVHLGGSGENINNDIASFVRSGLDARVQKALDIVRITGNNAVHPGELNLDDKPEIASRLFGLMNLIVAKMITEPKELDSFFIEMPVGAREAIDRRDSRENP